MIKRGDTREISTIICTEDYERPRALSVSISMPAAQRRTAMASEREKQAAAGRSLAFVRDGYVVGLGTGSTASHAIRLLGELVQAGLKIRAIPTSVNSRVLAAGLGIPLTTFDECSEIDVTIDGADEIDPALNLIKGGGGALLREKIVASASHTVVIIADASKQVPALGNFPLPVEVVPFAQALLARRIEALGASVTVRKDRKGRQFVTDEGHHILDCSFGEIPDPAGLAGELSHMPGVVEHGLFIAMTDIVLIGKGAEVLELRRPSDRPGPA
ncbi:MAG TPA: ribose-5-phosphate isomerase RpiA [Thermodesulfovibrionales bacterium]|nr:ribose-5-phosphate isomerase RpiA [Thermodesulfovibrionales bacterium]